MKTRGTWAFSKTIGRERALRDDCHRLFDLIWSNRARGFVSAADQKLRRTICYNWLAFVVLDIDPKHAHFKKMGLQRLEKVRAAIEGKTFSDIDGELAWELARRDRARAASP